MDEERQTPDGTPEEPTPERVAPRVEYATDKQRALAETRRDYERASAALADKLAMRAATVEDMQAVQDAAAALDAAEEMRVCFDCKRDGCTKPAEWTRLYHDLEDDNLRRQQVAKQAAERAEERAGALQAARAEIEALKNRLGAFETDLANEQRRSSQAREALDRAVEAADELREALDSKAAECAAMQERVVELEEELKHSQETVARLTGKSDATESEAIQ